MLCAIITFRSSLPSGNPYVSCESQNTVGKFSYPFVVQQSPSVVPFVPDAPEVFVTKKFFPQESQDVKRCEYVSRTRKDGNGKTWCNFGFQCHFKEKCRHHHPEYFPCKYGMDCVNISWCGKKLEHDTPVRNCVYGIKCRRYTKCTLSHPPRQPDVTCV